MAFIPVSLPIQELLLTNFVTDIASITNSNTLLLQDTLEDLVNNLEIDIQNRSIGTTTPISYIKTNDLIIEDSGLIYQSGSPTPTPIATLSKNGNNESIFTVDIIVANLSSNFNSITLNDLVVNSSSTFDGPSTHNAPLTLNSSVVESAESIQADLTWGGVSSTPATATLTLSNTSRQNIFITLKASTLPEPTPVYDGTSIDTNISEFNILIDFDSTNPPVPNTKFTIYLVDVINSVFASIKTPVQLATIPIKIIAGQNLSTSTPIILHDNVNSVGLANSNTFNDYRTNIEFNYIIDANNNDRLLATNLVGATLF
jgi:hypothetical protein